MVFAVMYACGWGGSCILLRVCLVSLVVVSVVLLWFTALVVCLFVFVSGVCDLLLSGGFVCCLLFVGCCLLVICCVGGLPWLFVWLA